MNEKARPRGAPSPFRGRRCCYIDAIRPFNVFPGAPVRAPAPPAGRAAIVRLRPGLGFRMLFVLIGVILIACNLLDIGPMAAWTWEFTGDAWKFALPFALAIVWWTYAGKATMFGLLAGFTVPDFTMTGWALLGLTAMVNVGCMLCFVIGYRTADATIAETGSFAGLLVGPMAGWLMFGETLGPQFWLGSAVLAAGILIALFEPNLKWTWRWRGAVIAWTRISR